MRFLSEYKFLVAGFVLFALVIAGAFGTGVVLNSLEKQSQSHLAIKEPDPKTAQAIYDKVRKELPNSLNRKESEEYLSFLKKKYGVQD